MNANIAIIVLLLINLFIFIAFSDADADKEKIKENNADFLLQQNSSQIRLLSLEEIHNLQNPQNSQNLPIAQNQQTLQDSQTPQTPEVSQDLSTPTQQCYAWKNVKIISEDFKKISQILVEKKLSHLQLIDTKQTQELQNNRWWIFIPPFATRQDAENRAKELLQNVVTEYFIIEKGEFKNAISLGIFSKENLAKDFLNGLKLRKVDEAKLLLRENKRTLQIVEFSGFSDQQELDKFIEILRKSQINLNFLSGAKFSKC